MQDTQPITANLLVIDGLNVSGLSTYKVSEEKIITSAKTNMLGSLRQTTIGSRVNIDATLTIANRGTLTTLIDKLQQPTLSVTYFDVRDNAVRSSTFIAGNWDAELLFKDRGLFEPFNITLTSVAVR